MRVAITGASGFLGRHLVEAFQDASFEVRGVVRTPSRAADLGIELAKADLADVDALTAAMHGVDVLVANAALAPGREKHVDEEFLRANVLGAQNHLTAAIRAGVRRIVWISSIAVYRTQLFKLSDESTPLLTEARFDWSQITTDRRYSNSKSVGEALAWTVSRAEGLALTVLRPGPIYGPYDPKLTEDYRRGASKKLAFAPTVRVPHVHGRDVANAAVAAVGNPRSEMEAYNVTGESVSPYQILRTFAKLGRTGCRVIPIPIPVRVRFDNSKAERDLGFYSRSVEATVESVLRAR